MKKYLVVMVMLLLPVKVLACSCAERTAEDYLAKCDNLFIARLVSAEYTENEQSGARLTGVFGEPTEVFKGDPGMVKGISERYSGNSCDQFPPIGAEYLVCGRNGDDFTGYSHCSYTKDHPEHYLRRVLAQLRDKQADSHGPDVAQGGIANTI